MTCIDVVLLLLLYAPRTSDTLPFPEADGMLAAWLDFLNLADAVLRQCPFYSVERLAGC